MPCYDYVDLEGFLDQIDVRLKKTDLHLDVKPLMRLICTKFFGDSHGFVSMCVNHFPSPKGGAANKVEQTYTGK